MVAKIVIASDLPTGESYKIDAFGGSIMSATGLMNALDNTTTYNSLATQYGGVADFSVSISVSHEQCNQLGKARVQTFDGVAPYTYLWSTGDTIAEIDGLTSGLYTLTTTDAAGTNVINSIEVDPPGPIYDGDGNQLDCAGERIYATLDLCTLLEGPYDAITQQMNTALNNERGLLPGQTPSSYLVTPTPSGQPYNQSPWNYDGTEGRTWSNINYSSDAVDWVLASFRTGISATTEITKTAGVLMKDGCINFPDRNVLPKNIDSSLYIVIEHRNHIGIMTPYPIEIIDNILTYDFRLSDSYRGLTGYGQKELIDGNWVMYAGDADQTDTPSYDINGGDKTLWNINNGLFDIYTPADFNLDGDVNGADKILWQQNNGISSRVPKH